MRMEQLSPFHLLGQGLSHYAVGRMLVSVPRGRQRTRVRESSVAACECCVGRTDVRLVSVVVILASKENETSW